jgi:hypothetical protein
MEKLTFRGAANPKNHFSVAAELQKINFCILGTSKNQLFAFWDLEKINFLHSGKFKKPTFHQLENVKISKHENLQLATLKKCKNTFVARQLNMCLPQAAAAVFSCPCNQSHLSGNSHFLRSETPETPKSHSIIVSSSSKQISRQFKVTLLCNRFEH